MQKRANARRVSQSRRPGSACKYACSMWATGWEVGRPQVCATCQAPLRMMTEAQSFCSLAPCEWPLDINADETGVMEEGRHVS